MSITVLVFIFMFLTMSFHFNFLRAFPRQMSLAIIYLFLITVFWGWNYFLPIDGLNKGYLGQLLLICIPLLTRSQQIIKTRQQLFIIGSYFTLATVIFGYILYSFLFSSISIVIHYVLLSFIIVMFIYELILLWNPNLGDDRESIFLTQFLKKVFLISSLVFICLMNFVSDPVTINFLLVFVYFFMFSLWGWDSYRKFPLRTIRLIVQSVIYLGLYSLGYLVAYRIFDAHFLFSMSPISLTFTFFFAVCIIFGFIKIMDAIRLKLNSFQPFTILRKVELQQLVDRLQRCVTFQELNKVINVSKIFHVHPAHLCVWHFRSAVPVELSLNTPTFPDDVMMILQYRERVLFQDLDDLVHVFAGTPLQSNIHVLTKFMTDNHILSISLLQHDGEMVGAMAILASDSKNDLLENDIKLIQQLAGAITSTIINLESIERLSAHQLILEDVNAALSYMDLAAEKTELQEQVILSLLKVIPNMSYFMLLSYDGLSGFFRQSTPLSHDTHLSSFRLHADEILNELNDNVLCKFFIDQADTPQQLKDYMHSIHAKQAIIIRLDDADVSSIFVAFFKVPTDISDSRVSYCQMLLRQFELFLDYQDKFDKLSKLQSFLTGLLDHLPTGIVIVDSEKKVIFSNNKFSSQFKDLRHGDVITKFPEPLHIATYEVDQKEQSYLKKVQFSNPDLSDWYLLSGFHLYFEKEKHIVLMLTNIQQSKELIDQMNQANRLAMMSKIANGISHELKAPVKQLVQGVEDIKGQWQKESFQDHFTTVVIPQVDRINLLCQSLLRLSRTNVESLVNVYLPDLLDQVMRLIAGDLQYSKHAFYVVYLEKTSIVIDQVMAIQVLMNLMIFSLNFLAIENSKLFLEIRVTDDEFLFLKVNVQNYKNHGFIDECDLKDQFELSIVNQIVINQNGRFDIDCSDTVTIFNVFLPIKFISSTDVAKPKVNSDLI